MKGATKLLDCQLDKKLSSKWQLWAAFLSSLNLFPAYYEVLLFPAAFPWPSRGLPAAFPRPSPGLSRQIYFVNLFLLTGRKCIHFNILRYPREYIPLKKYGVWARHIFRVWAILGNRESVRGLPGPSPTSPDPAFDIVKLTKNILMWGRQ